MTITVRLVSHTPLDCHSWPSVLAALTRRGASLLHLELTARSRKEKEKRKPPLNVGVMFLEDEAAQGSANVIAGILDALKGLYPSSKLYGFWWGQGGLLRGEYKELSPEPSASFRNSGGFDMIGSDRTKIEKEEDFEKVRQLAQRLDLNAIIIIGGDISNTNAALLAEYMAEKGCPLQVIGCPKTIDGDLKNRYIETSFGFDTCVKSMQKLSRKYPARLLFGEKVLPLYQANEDAHCSHLTLECALMCQPTVAIIRRRWYEIETFRWRS